VLGYLSLVPGAIVLDWLVEADIAGLVAGLMVLFFTSLILALVAARGPGPPANRPDGRPGGDGQMRIGSGGRM
jgi:hypothetical protein